MQDNAPADTRSIESIVYLVIAIEVNELYTVLSWSDINPIPIDGLSDGAMIIRDKKLSSGMERRWVNSQAEMKSWSRASMRL